MMHGPSWYKWALGELGTSEVPGKGSNPIIIDYRKKAKVPISGDDSAIAWCAIFVGAGLEINGYPGTHSARARSYENWGRPVGQLLGAVTVLWRKSMSSGFGHIGYLHGVSADRQHVCLLGGNQGDKVSVAWFPRSRVLGYRFPTHPTKKPAELRAPTITRKPGKPQTET